MEWSIILLTLIAAVLIGYIAGKGGRSSPAESTESVPTIISSATSPSSPRAKKKSVRSRSLPNTAVLSEAPPAGAASSVAPVAAAPAQQTAGVDGEATNPTAAAAAAVVGTSTAASSRGASPVSTPAAHSRRTSSASEDDLVEAAPRGAMRPSKRIVIVAKQLPILTRVNPATGRFTREDPVTGESVLESQEWEDNRSFLSGLRALRADGFQVTWVGVPNTGGVPVPRDEQETYEELLSLEGCVPVYLSPELSDKFFNGFCKGVLWPMLHYVLPQSNQQFSAQWDELWQAYNAANAAFSTVISRCVETPTDTVWVHNYHLLLLPSLLRRKLPRAKIGLFIHTPFPSSDVFRVLPTRHNILSSIMAADLLGFHTFDYARHFLSCIKRVMDLDFDTLPGGSLGIKYSGRFVSILISHVGIDSRMFQETREDVGLPPPVDGQPVEGTVAYELAQLRAKYAPRRVIISAGDLDSVKGGLLKFQAYERFLDQYPQWSQDVVFVEMLLPNRSVRLDHVKDLKESLAQQVEVIHAKHGRACFEVMHLKEALPLRSAVAHFVAADLCIASQFWDGLCLLPFEYTASQRDQTNPGALIISEFMGCSRTLSGVVRVNPWNLDDVASAINAALSMTPAERVVNHHRRYKYVMEHTILRWGRGFLQHLDRATKLCEGMNYVQVGWGSNVKLMGLRSDFTHLDEEATTAAYRRAERRVLLLDYDGTLTPAEKTAQKSRLMGPSRAVKKLLHALSRDQDNIVFIMSGRTRSTLTEWFPTSEFPNLGLAAEKGLFLRWPERLTFLCRQDLRRDPHLKRRIETVRAEKAEARAAALQQNAQLTSETRSRAFQFQAAATARLDALESSNGDAAESAEEKGDAAAPAGDAHLLVEDAVVPVDDTEWEYMIGLDDVSWKSMALEIIRSYTEQTDGSWIEDKEFAIVWHYEQADPEYGRIQASELQKYLVKVLANPSVDVVRYDYNRILEVKPHGVSKGLAATAILEELFLMHDRMKSSRPPSPTASSGDHDGFGRGSQRGSYKDLASLSASSPTSPSSSHVRGLSSSVFPSCSAASSLPPFLFAVGDDRSDEDMFVSLQNKDYLEGRLRGAPHAHHLVHQHSMHTGHVQLPNSEGLLKRSQSVVSAHQHRAAKERTGGEIDEKAARERRTKRAADPFTFTVCVGMKPSNAHYYMHDDEEVVRLLSALGTSSQRMEQTRAADHQALAFNPASSPLAGTSAREIGTITLESRARPAAPGGFHLRPADIPTSPPLPTSAIQANYTLQSAARAMQQRHQQSLHHQSSFTQSSSRQPTSRPRAESHSASEDDVDDDDDDDDDASESDSDEERFRRSTKQSSRSLSELAGGLRRTL